MYFNDIKLFTKKKKQKKNEKVLYVLIQTKNIYSQGIWWNLA